MKFALKSGFILTYDSCYKYVAPPELDCFIVSDAINIPHLRCSILNQKIPVVTEHNPPVIPVALWLQAVPPCILDILPLCGSPVYGTGYWLLNIGLWF